MLNENTLLRKNVRELQSQLRASHIRIAKLNEEIYYLKKQIDPDKSIALRGGWAEMDENPDASHIEKDNNQLDLKLNKDKKNDN
jgi:hypothetical protein